MDNGFEFLDHAHDVMKEKQFTPGLDRLCDGIRKVRRGTDTAEWRWVVHEVLREHPVRQIVHEDPLTNRSFSKPRGYPGDAVLLDYVYYGSRRVPAGTSAVGSAVFDYTAGSGLARGLRDRRRLLAARIDEAAAETPRPRILSIACGHMRELELSSAVAERRIGACFGLDHDGRSLAIVSRDHPDANVQVIHAPVRRLLTGRLGLEGFDFVYSAGLFDYLGDRVATRLIDQMVAMLSPGGRLLIANVLPDVDDAAYVEAYMDWPLIYRTEEQMHALLSQEAQDALIEPMLFRDGTGNYAFLQARRA